VVGGSPLEGNRGRFGTGDSIYPGGTLAKKMLRPITRQLASGSREEEGFGRYPFAGLAPEAQRGQLGKETAYRSTGSGGCESAPAAIVGGGWAETLWDTKSPLLRSTWRRRVRQKKGRKLPAEQTVKILLLKVSCVPELATCPLV